MAAKKKKWDKDEILKRLMRIAEEAKKATWSVRTGKNGESVKEYDAKCASIELKAVEYAVKLSGLLGEEKEKDEVVVTLSDDVRPFAV